MARQGVLRANRNEWGGPQYGRITGPFEYISWGPAEAATALPLWKAYAWADALAVKGVLNVEVIS